jgi:arabinogalactan endo-1,4-beta-galactosidase
MLRVLAALAAALAAAAPPRAPAASAAAAARPFLLGTDLSYLPMLDGGGAASPFRARAGGPTGDALAMAAAGGATHVRLRLWVDPLEHNPTGWPARGDDTYANLTSVLAMSARVAQAGMRVWLDLHYSDTWADPGHQAKPARWAAMTLPDLIVAVARHTVTALSALAAQGTPADVVQVGNEVSAGMLWAGAGGPCASGGALFAAGCNETSQWGVFGALMGAGLQAARKAQPDALIIVHTDLGNKLNTSWGAAYIVQWYASLVAATAGAGGADLFDAIGLSAYPHWGFGATSNVKKLSVVRAAFPTKSIILCETSWPYKGGPASPWDEFPFTPDGQTAFLRAVTAEVRALEGGAGLAWWGAEYYNMSSGAGWTSLWDEGGVALPALAAWAL